MGVLKACKPRKEVLKGDLDDAIFAADFGNLISGNAPKVYGIAKTFFQNTHPAQQLCKVVQTVFGRLADAKERGATVRLSTGFGGGKTHTLMALWHLAKNIGNSKLGTDLLPAAGRPRGVTVVAVDRPGCTALEWADDRHVAVLNAVPSTVRYGDVEVERVLTRRAGQVYGLAGNGKETDDGCDENELPNPAQPMRRKMTHLLLLLFG